MSEHPSLLVVKVGGSAGIDYAAVADDIAQLIQQGRKIVLIHGGSSMTNDVATALGHPPEFITSPSGYTSRYTDRRTMEIFQMVYCGQMNKGIVELLQQRSINAVGLSGMDGRIWEGERKPILHAALPNGRKRIIRDNLTGTVDKVNVGLLRLLLAEGFLPVLTPPAISYGGEAINVDGDRAAGQTAIALQATDLIILSNIPGVLANFPDESSLVRHIARKELESSAEKYAQGRMKIKLLGSAEALDGGVRRVILGDARIANPITQALAGQGTVIEGRD